MKFTGVFSLMMARRVFLLAAAATASAQPVHQTSELHIRGAVMHGHQISKARITPELEPVSDAKFMKKDYPDDRRPKPFHKFDYPFPTVQDSEDYDHDYVEDKNDDGGYWAAQMRYDKARNKMAKEMDEMKKALAKKEEERKELEAAKLREEQAEKEAEAAEAAENEADTHHDKAERTLQDVKKEVNASVDEVENEITDLEECKKQLKEAREKLKKHLEEKAAAEKAKLEKDANETKMEKDEVAAEATEAELEKKVQAEEQELKEAMAAYEAEKAKVDRTKADLAKAEEKLRALRGETEPAKSMAERPVAVFLAVLVSVACAFAH